MREITLEEIQRKFDSLPENLRLAIILAGADKKINTIGREHGLNVSQISDLLLKTHIMMFGFIHPDKFEDSLKEIKNIPPQIIRGIVRDVNEQIIKDMKDDLVALAEKPEDMAEMEKIEENQNETIIPKTKEISQEEKENNELLKSIGAQIIPIEGNNETKTTSIKEDARNTEILKSAGIEIDNFDYQTKEGEDKTKKKDLNLKNSFVEKIKDDAENTEILKSAGIEIAGLGIEKETKPISKTEKTNIFDINKNEEVIKIAFDNLPKKEALENTVVLKETQHETKLKPKTEQTLEIKGVEELKEIVAPQPVLESKTIEIQSPGLEKPIKTIPDKIEETNDPNKAIKKEKVEIFDESAHKPEEIKTGEEPVDKKLKSLVQDIIKSYQQKNESETSKVQSVPYSIKSTQATIEPKEGEIYQNVEDKKRSIVLQIVEIQDKMKKLKERTMEIEREKDKIEKERKTNPESEKNGKLKELFEEDKIIQKLREVDLPAEYLELLEKLDKITVHKTNTPKQNPK